MGRDVNKSAPRSSRAKDFPGSAGAHVQLRLRKDGSNCSDFLEDVWRRGIRDAQHQRAGRWNPTFVATKVIDAGAGSVGNRKAVADVLLAIEPRVKRKVGKKPIR